MMKARNLFAALLFAALPATATVPAVQTTDVIEFYNATLDHYFVTTDTKEAADLDNGVHPGWKRTGLTFQAIKAGETVAGSVGICRFYGSPAKGLDSHFYSASAAECTAVQAQFADSWLLESSEVFRAFPVDPNTGKCPSGAESVFRLWNNRSDVNHRYTDQTTVYAQMIAKGYVAEGNGNPSQPVIFCMPMKDVSIAPAGTPACTLTSSSNNPLLGSPITLTATCTNNPTTFAWTNCTSTTSTCTSNNSVAGVVSYAVTGSNGTGSGNTAKLDVTWGSSGGPVPICTISATSTNPTAGSGVTLTANCSQSPGSYSWMTCNYLLQNACNLIPNCPAGSSSCSTNQSIAGLAHYAVEAVNSAGRGPRAGIDIDWGGSGGGGGGGGLPTAPVCNLFASSNNPTINSNVTLSASCTGNPTSYAWTNCTSNGAACNATAANAGAVTYSVVASNSAGNSAPATVQVTWQNPAPPSCTVSASNSTPMAGGTVTLTASCSGSPTSFVWTNCTSSAATCQATSANAGAVVYSVAGINAAGAGPAANVTVTWQPRPTAPPSCTVSSSSQSPFTGQQITLTATCTNAPQSYAWTNCSSSSSTCLATSSSAGSQTYSVQATNVVGTSAPASTTVVWQQSLTPPDFCASYKNVVQTVVPWGSSPTIYTKDFGPLKADGVAVVAIVIPSTLSPNAWGRLQWAEYVDPRGDRQATLSRSPCDFRSPDPTGINGPLVVTGGVSGDVYYNLASARFGYPEGHVLAGQTYYISLRQNSGCGTSGSCNMVLGLSWN